MLNKKIVILTATLTVLILLLLSPAQGAFALKGLEEGAPAPDFSAKTLEGKKLGLAELRGKGVVVLCFWATWSSRSPKILQDLAALEKQYGPKGMVLWTVNVDHETFGAEDLKIIKEFLSTHGLNIRMVLDEHLNVFSLYGIISVPTTLVIDHEGKILFIQPGYPVEAKENLQAAVEKPLGLYVEKAAAPTRLAYQPQQNALLYYNMGKKLFNQGLADKALGPLQEANKRDPDYPAPYTFLGRVYLEKNEAAPAKEALKKAVALSPRDFEPALLLGTQLLKEGNLKEAEPLLAAALKLEPSLPDTHQVYARLLSAQKKFKEAEAEIKQALDLNRRCPSCYYRLGQIYEDAQDQGKALGAYKQALELLYW